MALGLFAVVTLPREEEPQIVVPMIDVFVTLPGAAPAEVEQRVTRPLEKLLWEVPGVEYVYSTSSPGQSTIIVRFLVGEDEARALVRLNEKLAANVDRLPPAASAPLVKTRSIDNVPILSVTLWGGGHDDHQLRLVAAQLGESIAEAASVSEVTIIGGRRREVTVEVDPARLASARVDPLQIAVALDRSNVRSTGAGPIRGSLSRLETGRHLMSASDVRNAIVKAGDGYSVVLGDVATVIDGGGDPTSYVRFHSHRHGASPAVTIAVAKRKGANAITVAREVEAKLAAIRPALLPGDIEVSITRNYGETAADKSNELLYHMLLAVLSVSALIAVVLGLREAAIVLLAIPVTLALTLFAFLLYGYTLNRITLFALIFSIGILVDDAIVVVENIVRHARMRDADSAGSLAAVAVRAVDEVGNPTILATLTVIAAILPMAFVGGLMGPYMRPIPVGASAAMLFSLGAAFIVTPWAAIRLLRAAAPHRDAAEDAATRLYRRGMGRLITSARARLVFLGGVAVLLVAAVALVPLKIVTVKMLPFDNKREFQVIVDMPEGTPLEQTARVPSALAGESLQDAGVHDVQSYVGVSSPYNFNGLVRHYFLRRGAHLAELQVNLLAKDEREDQSHDVAKRIRTRLLPLARQLGATIQVAEVPPGPPVLQTLVAEIYGPDAARRQQLAQHVKSIFEQTDGVVDVDWYVEAPQPKTILTVDDTRAASAGLQAADVATAVRMATAGERIGLLHDEAAREEVPIVLRLPRAQRRSLETVRALRLGSDGVAIGEMTREEAGVEAASIYHKNLRPVTYITGDLAGAAESPVYAILRMNELISQVVLPEGYAFEIFSTEQPSETTKYAMKWDGEWHITYEVFRDLGIAFAAVLVLIYILVVWWFQSFSVPF